MDLTKDSSQIRKWGKKEEEKSQAPRGIWTQDHLIASRVLYLCATTTAQMPLFGSKRKMFIGTGAIFISPHIFAFLYYLLSLGNRFEDLLCLLVTPPNLTRWSILLHSYYRLAVEVSFALHALLSWVRIPLLVKSNFLSWFERLWKLSLSEMHLYEWCEISIKSLFYPKSCLRISQTTKLIFNE